MKWTTHICLLLTACCAPASAEVIFDWATIGNAGNQDDVTGYGGVDYTYNISKHEVTNAQYMEFLNAVATVGDVYGLYNTSMGSTYGGIDRDGAGTVGDPYAYSAKGGDSSWLDRPVNYVSFFDAMRFTNWLHNGQGSGDTESGAYTIGNGTNEARSPNALYWVPSEDEWYKAAYHKNDGVTGNYFRLPASSDVTLSNALVDPDPGNSANFNYSIGGPYYLTEVGDFENSESPYGTFDQGGNVQEWNQAVINGGRGRRGASFVSSSDTPMQSSSRFSSFVALESLDLGFRVATVPEPSTMLMGTLAAVGFLLRRRD